MSRNWRDGEGMATHEQSDLPRRRTCPRCKEAAAFLDRLANSMDYGGGPITAADCRAMAARLRGGGKGEEP